MNLTSALLKQIITQEDFDTWGNLRENYLANEYQPLYKAMDTHIKNFNALPTFDDLKLSIRDRKLQEKVFAIEAVDIDIDAWVLLEYVKNEYTQVEILNELDGFIDKTVAISNAEENVEALQTIVLDIGDRVDLKPPEENMQTIALFDTEKDLKKYLPLGLNDEYDQSMKFSPRDLVLVGGRRGAGKSLTCVNIANNVYEQGRSSIYFTIEMDSRSILQRMCALGARIPISRLATRNLTNVEWKNHGASYHGGDIDVVVPSLENKVVTSVNKLCESFDNEINLDYVGVVRWPVGTFMKPHVDDNNVHNPDVFAAMLYLNEGFSGGHTIFEEYDIKPKTGKLIVFSNSQLLHYVTQVEGSERFVLSFWYKRLTRPTE